MTPVNWAASIRRMSPEFSAHDYSEATPQRSYVTPSDTR
jgi:hypothetical protein